MSLAHFLAVAVGDQRAWGSASSDTTQALTTAKATPNVVADGEINRKPQKSGRGAPRATLMWTLIWRRRLQIGQ